MTRLAQVCMDAVAPLMPFDKTASQVAGKGEHFEWQPERPGAVHSSEPIALRYPAKAEVGQPSFIDLTGAKIGRLTVQGIAAEIITSGGQNWSVRCVCGSYEVRKAKYIKNALVSGCDDTGNTPMCMWCAKTNKLRMGMHDPAKAKAAARIIQECAR